MKRENAPLHRRKSLVQPVGCALTYRVVSNIRGLDGARLCVIQSESDRQLWIMAEAMLRGLPGVGRRPALPVIVEAGARYGWLVATGENKLVAGQPFAEMRCTSCHSGRETWHETRDVLRGRIKSCGCHRGGRVAALHRVRDVK